MSDLVTVRHEDGGHWYRMDGSPCYEVECSTRSGTRPVRITDARKLSLVPSVTTVQRVLAAPALERWRLRLHLEEALTNPSGVPEDVIRRVRDRMREAPDAGSLIHAEIERYVAAEYGLVDSHADSYTTPPETLSAVKEWCTEVDLRPHGFEVPFSSNLGYGGKVDLVGEFTPDIADLPVIVDWKTTETNAKKPPKAWPNHCVQLAAYAHGVGMPDAEIVNVVISRNQPGRIGWHWWTQEEKERSWEMFRHLLRVWQIENNYVPPMEDTWHSQTA